MEHEQATIGETQRLTRALRRNSSTLSSKRSTSQSPGENGTNNKAAAREGNSNTSSPGGGEKLSATRQSSRIKLGTKKRKSEPIGKAPTPTTVADTDDSTADNEFDQELERCAYDLAALDRKACARTQLRDANALLHKFLIPMSLPWTYPPGARSAAAAYDIEDLPGCRMDHDGPSVITVVPFGGSVPHVKRSRQDPGVLELSVPSINNRSTSLLEDSTWATLPQDYEKGVPGELALHLYNETHSSKRLKVGKKPDEAEPMQISIRFGTVSSRAHILQDTVENKHPLFLAAILPRVAREGHRRRGCEQAVKEALALGSYNCRVIPPGAMVKDPKLAERLWLGRTRLIWSEKDPPKEGTNRSPYRSLLTKQKYPLESLRRPENMKVAVRLNGEIVSYTGADKPMKENSNFMSIVDEALGGLTEDSDSDTSAAPDIPTGEPKVEQYRLNHEKLFLACKSSSGYVGSSLERIRELFTISTSQSNGDQSSSSILVVLPPVMDCVPSEEGLLSVVCAVPGSMQLSGASTTEACNKIARFYQRCVVCWQSTATIGSFGPAVKCSRCNIQAHTYCRGIDAAANNNAKWVCGMCSKEDTEHECSLCDRKGGLVENSNGVWAHDVCRIWCAKDTTDHPEGETSTCIYCNSSTGRLVACLGNRCLAQFHPHCAAFSRACAQIQHDGKAKDDAFLCTQPTLTLMDVSTATASSPRQRRTRNKTTLPVAFCGYHNPQRDAMLCGLYPDALFIKDAMRIPPARERTVCVGETS